MEEAASSCCGKRCTLAKHGDMINAAIRKSSLSDNQIASYVNFICKACGSSVDSDGRSALQVAASSGRTDVCKWLICQKQAKINFKDAESGYTALHRCLYNGKVETAVAIIQLGANVRAMDINDFTPLDHISLYSGNSTDEINQSLVYSWGANSNYTLGPNPGRKMPDIMDVIHKNLPDIHPMQVLVEKYHTVVTTWKGKVYSFGNGQGGRLGQGTDKTILEPAEVKFKVGQYIAHVCIQMTAIARNHCLFLTERNDVWACGSNTHHVLGLSPPPAQLLRPRQLKLKEILGIACARYHSVAWNASTLYTWGYNGGQLGHDKSLGKMITIPKSITCLSFAHRNIISAAASNGATALATDRGDVFLMYEFKSKLIASRVTDIQELQLFGGNVAGIDEKQDDLRLLALTKSGRVYVWQSQDEHLCRCVFSLSRSIYIRQAVFNVWGLMLVSTDGEVFKGKLCERLNKTTPPPRRRIGSSFSTYLEADQSLHVTLERVPRIYNAHFIANDLEGQNFVALIINPAMMSTNCDIAPSTMRTDIARLQGEHHLGDDAQVEFRVENRNFRIHSYILRLNSKELSAKPDIDIDVDVEIFSEIVDYMYQGVCSLMQEGPVPERFVKFLRMKKNPVKMLQEAAKKLGVFVLQKLLNHFSVKSGKIRMQPENFIVYRKLKLKPDDCPEFCDVTLVASCGGRINAHKCVLGVRSEFFANRFSARWASAQEIQLPATLAVVRDLLEYLYTDMIYLKRRELDQVLNLLVLADHILLERLVQICERNLRNMMTSRNVLQLFIFSDTYNALQLKIGCMEVVCQNLALMLETRSLESIPLHLLKELTHFYAAINGEAAYREMNPPEEDEIGDEVVLDAHALHPVKFDFHEIAKAEPEPVSTSAASRHQRRRNRNVSAYCEKRSARIDELLANTVKVKIPEASEPRNVEYKKPPRLSAICRAQEVIVDEVAGCVLTREDFPDLNSSREHSDRDSPKSPRHKDGKMFRLSQRERKRLGSVFVIPEDDVDILPALVESPRCCWNVHSDHSTWEVSSTEFDSIVSDEKQMKKNYYKMIRKPLIYTQNEEKAMRDLENFYNIANVNDEIIRVERVFNPERVGAPSWVLR